MCLILGERGSCHVSSNGVQIFYAGVLLTLFLFFCVHHHQCTDKLLLVYEILQEEQERNVVNLQVKEGDTVVASTQ